MRITIIGINYAPEVTGIAPYTRDLAEGLAARGHTIDVITGLPHYPEWSVHDGFDDGETHHERHGRVTIRHVPHYVPSNPRAVNRVRMEMSFARALATHAWRRPDLVIAVSPALIASCYVVARAKAAGIPVGVIVHDIYSKGVVETGAMPARAAKVLSRMEASLINSATGAVVIHDRFVDTLAGIGARREQMTVIGNWTHVRPIPADRFATRRRLGWADDEVVVLHSGNMGLKQGLGNVVDAAKLADNYEMPVRFVLMGDGNQRAALEASAPHVQRLDFIDPLPDAEYMPALAAADILLVNERPGVTEMAVPSKLTSYFAAGRPILAATDPRGATAAEMRRADAGRMVASGDPGALLEAAWLMAADSAAGEQMSAAGRRYAGKSLDRDAALNRYDRWCTTLMHRHHLGNGRLALVADDLMAVDEVRPA